MRIMLAAALIAAVAVPASARDAVAYRTVAAGDLATAERMLIAERRIFPQRPELMLNLAAVYARTDRAAAAASLYRSVLALPAVEMDLPSGDVASSHRLASRGLAHVAPAIAAR